MRLCFKNKDEEEEEKDKGKEEEKKKRKLFPEPLSGKASRISLPVSYRDLISDLVTWATATAFFVGLVSLGWENDSLKRQRAETKPTVSSSPRPTLAQRLA